MKIRGKLPLEYCAINTRLWISFCRTFLRVVIRKNIHTMLPAEERQNIFVKNIIQSTKNDAVYLAFSHAIWVTVLMFGNGFILESVVHVED